ncbi:MAG: MTH1187 family thiamine-binding protein [Deltaproteobacteria bacterium]|nr:MTH1187 family thiamine-binding protein [Deltaproteobacteria bacterium]
MNTDDILEKNPVILCDFSMYPLDAEGGLSAFVAKSIEIIEESGIPYKLSPMSTTIEGSFDDCMACIKKCFDTMSESSKRIAFQIKVDYRHGRINGMNQKIQSVEKKLGHSL